MSKNLHRNLFIEKEDNIGPKELIDSFKKVQHIFEIVKIHANREMKRLEKGTDNSVLTKERIKSENFRKFQFSSNSAQDVRRRGNLETSRNIIFLRKIYKYYKLLKSHSNVISVIVEMLKSVLTIEEKSAFVRAELEPFIPSKAQSVKNLTKIKNNCWTYF